MDRRETSRAIHALEGLLPGHRIREANDRFDGAIDLEVHGPEEVVLVKAAALPEQRLRDLRGLLAEATLRLRHHGTGRSLMALVSVPQLTRRLTKEAEEFMATYACDLDWMLVDRAGALRIRSRALGLDEARAGDPELTVLDQSSGVSGRRFTDLHQWLLKVVLAQALGWRVRAPNPTQSWLEDLEQQLVAAAPARNALQLSRIAGVSTATAYRFVRVFRDARYIEASPIVLRRADELLDEWLAVERSRPPARTPVVGVFGREFERLVADPDVRVAGLEALRRLGLLHRPPGRVVDLHCRGHLSDLLGRLDLAPCEPHEAHFNLIASRDPESVFRGAVFGTDGAVDPWQAALDVCASDARGAEQAELVRDWALRRLDERRR